MSGESPGRHLDKNSGHQSAINKMKSAGIFPVYFNSVAKKANYYKKEILLRIGQIISSGTFLNGQWTTKLEHQLENYLNGGNVITVASGHDALLLALASLKLSPQDEVIVPANAYPTAFPVALSTAKLILVDVDENGQISFDDLIQKITPKTKVIIIVHMYGITSNLKKIMQLLKMRKVFIIEDCAQSFGTLYNNRPVGTWGDIGCFSFYPTKNVGTLGDGGAIWTKHHRYYAFFQKAKSYGEKTRYFSTFISGHSRMPEMQAAIISLYLDHFNKEKVIRKQLKEYFDSLIQKYKLEKFVTPIQSDKRSSPIFHLYPVKVKRRDLLRSFLSHRKIETHIHYPLPIHLQPSYAYLGYKKGDFSVAEHLSRSLLSLPFHSYLTKKQIQYVVESIHDFYYRSKPKQISPFKQRLKL